MSLIVRGLLGWSNVRPGLELYRWDPHFMPRHGSEWGDLLVNEVSRDDEGRAVLVVVLPGRGATAEDLADLESRIAAAIEDA